MTRDEWQKVSDLIDFHLERKLQVHRRAMLEEVHEILEFHRIEYHSSRRPSQRRISIRPLILVAALSMSTFAGHLNTEAVDVPPCEQLYDPSNPSAYCDCVKGLRANLTDPDTPEWAIIFPVDEVSSVEARE